MATFEKPKPSERVPADLLPVIYDSGVMTERQFAELRTKVQKGDYPNETMALADRLVEERILTEYQVARFLKNKSHGLVVGRYIILDRLGSGSMGRVFKAHHLMMDRVVALKIIAPEIVSNERVVARFQREMKLVGRLDHPNVVRAFDADQMNRVLYIVMEYVSGESLGRRLRKGVIPPAEMVAYAAQAALGLGHAHAQGIVHRDIKPSNLLLTEDRKVKVLDLGLGVLMEADEQSTFATADGIAVGTVDYMSPEQACGRDVDGRSDLFSLGCAMYHLIAGRLPFPGDSPIERLGKRLSGQPIPITKHLPDLPSGLVQIIDKLLAHKPEDRFQKAEDAAEALQALLRPRSRPAASGDAAHRKPPPPVVGTASVEAIPVPRAAVSVAAPAAPAPAAPAPVVPAPVVPSPADAAGVPVAPEYPRWFRPLASLAERKPRVALMAMLGALAAAMGGGFGLAWLLR
jgi:serine/threonine-protein kinase